MKFEIAFKEGKLVRTPNNIGITKIKRIANLFLPTGKILIGFPGHKYVNVANEVSPEVKAGVYPVYITFAEHLQNYRTFAFAFIKVNNNKVVTWEEAGSFFTDDGTGFFTDYSNYSYFVEHYQQNGMEKLRKIKYGVLEDGDGNYIINEKIGLNVVIFRVFDNRYECFIGKDKSGEIACIIVDGYHRDPWKDPKEVITYYFSKFIKTLTDKFNL